MDIDQPRFKFAAEQVKRKTRDTRMTENRASEMARNVSGTFDPTVTSLRSLSVRSLVQGSVRTLVIHRFLSRPPYQGMFRVFYLQSVLPVLTFDHSRIPEEEREEEGSRRQNTRKPADG